MVYEGKIIEIRIFKDVDVGMVRFRMEDGRCVI